MHRCSPVTTISLLLGLIAVLLSSSTAFLHIKTPTITSRKFTPTKSSRFFFDFLNQNEPEKVPEEDSQSSEDSAVSDDPVDKIFGFFFGEKEDEPMGMKRFGRGAFLIAIL